MAWIKYGSGEGADQLNIVLSITRAIYRNRNRGRKDRLQAFVKVWMYEVLDLPDSMNDIAAALYLLIKETGYKEQGLISLSRKCDKKLSAVSTELAITLSEWYRNTYNFN